MPDLLPPDDKLGASRGNGGSSSSSGSQAMQMTFGKGFKNKRKDAERAQDPVHDEDVFRANEKDMNSTKIKT